MKTEIAIAAAAEFALNGMLKYAESLARVRQMQAEGRTSLTVDEWQAIVSDIAANRAAAQEAVDLALSQGR